MAAELRFSKAELEALYNDERLTVQQMAERLDCSVSALGILMRRYGIVMRKQGPTSAIDINELVKQYEGDERTPPRTLRELAPEYGTTFQNLSALLRAAGARMRRPGERIPVLQ